MAVDSTSWSLWSTSARLVVTDASALPEATRLVQAYLLQVELAASRFRPDSEIQQLRPDEHAEATVSTVLADLLREALRAARRTDGLVDPTVGTAMRRIGYDRDIELVVRDGLPVSAVVRPVPGWQCVKLDGNRLRMPRGVELDLGATAKALAADRIAARVARETGAATLLSLGGDVAVAGPPREGGWPVRVAEDHAAPLEGPGQVVALDAGGLATSSTSVRAWPADDGVAHHVIDPRTGRPALTPWRLVSVAGSSCFAANVLATGALVSGAGAVAWLAARGAHARLVGAAGIVRLVGGWPAEERAAA